MILEGLVTTLDAGGLLNVAPMGPRVGSDFQRLLLRPFRSSTTFRNLAAHGEGVFHVTDDVLLLARATIGKVSDAQTRPAERVSGRILLDCCRYYEFRVTDVDDREDRVSLTAEVVRHATVREFFGFNRAKHAVLETAILASRIDFLPLEGLAEELKKHLVVVEKTGAEREAEAFVLLENHIRSVVNRRNLESG